ncbi:MAG: serine hydrolase [Burkholderiaceae bacterium]|nr:serine hydrolase [Burkholderiaceae bacterium]
MNTVLARPVRPSQAAHRCRSTVMSAGVATLLSLLGAQAATAAPRDDASTVRQMLARAQTTSTAPVRIPGLLKNYLLMLKQTPTEGVDEAPDEGRGDPNGLALVLPQVLDTVDQVLATAPTAMLGALEAARTGFGNGLAKLHAGSTDSRPQHLHGVLLAMADGQAAMDQALDIAATIDPPAVALLLPAVQAAREAARRTSRSTMDLAVAAGVSSGRLAPAETAMRTADALFDAGDYGGAGQQYAGAFDLAANTLVFSMDRFEQNLRSVFDANTVGWAYAISQGGNLARSGSAGLARTGADLPQTNQSPTRKMHVASVSKTMTAIVVLRRLAEMGLSVDSAIGPWLPAGWARGNGVDALSFRQLMTHTSGFGQNGVGGNDFDGLKTMVAQDVPAQGSFKYFNANFGLLRVITAKLLGIDPTGWPVDPGAITTAAFLSYAQGAYNTAGVPFSCEPQGSNPTRQYEFPDSGNPGYAEPSRSLSCGGFGVQISATNLTRTLSYLRYTQDLMPTPQFQTMKAGFLGFMNPVNYDYAQGVFGTYHGHGGDWDHTGSGGLDACVVVFPINVEVAVTINSSRKVLGQGYPNGGYQCRVIKWAFENAWIAN